MVKRLLILHDSPDFGGHEHMLLSWLPGVLDPALDTATTICVPEANRRLVKALEPFATRMRILTWAFVKQRGEPYLHRFRFRYRAAVRKLIIDEKPDTVLLVQGRIENLAVPMSALPKSMRVVSYLPMAHKLTEMQRKTPFGDFIRRRLYARPDKFIVPSLEVAAQVAAAGGRGEAAVVSNVVSVKQRVEPKVARALLGLPSHKHIALFLGRLDRGQKGLDTLRQAIERAAPQTLTDWCFVFAGDGPEASSIATLRDRGVADIHLSGWTDQPDKFLSAADVLLLPSRWEGLPLVMLEAMHFGVPVLASSLAVFKDALPEASIVDFTTVDLGRALDHVLASTGSFRQHATHYLQPLTLNSGQRDFANALVGKGA